VSSLATKKILLGVSGSIAAYKACDLASRLVKDGAHVTAVLTKGARRFVTPYAFEALTGRPCLTRLFKRIASGESAYPHIHPPEDADAVILAPATAGLMARLAHGMTGDLLSALMLSVRCPVFVCPAMNVNMWEHPATQANAETLKRFGHVFLGPDGGALACGMKGAGRMMEPEEIVARVSKALARAPKKGSA
jgi:phosphopantothenoylcysteine decarboxylase/phosphopantothenate--cysteine ligase